MFSPDGVLSQARRACVVAMRERLAHRGPDGAGLWEGPGAAIGHRRLAVVDLSDAAAQPMVSEDGRFVLAYNGELYNDAEVRSDLRGLGVSFRTASDTETMLRALATWGPDALSRVRGMYAFCFVDAARRVALLGRDPLGVKPLYTAMMREGGAERFAFASELRAFAAIPDFELRTDELTAAAYLTTARTTLEERTLLRGVSLVRAGALMRVRYAGGAEEALSITAERAPEFRTAASADTQEIVQDAVRAGVQRSVRAHLRSDAPLCALLSGGLDSSIIVAEASRVIGVGGGGSGRAKLRTYCSGAKGATAPGGDDFAFARMVAEHFGCEHAEVPVTQESFGRLWPEMVARQLVPLSTPNEVAIFEVSSALRGSGNKVALSGEGADELFGGYDLALEQSCRFLDRTHPLLARNPDLGPGGFELFVNAWLSPEVYGEVLEAGFVRRNDPRGALTAAFEREFAAGSHRAASAGTSEGSNTEEAGDLLQAHLRFQQRINLAGLLLRLDSATMLAGVEGRTPFADVVVRALAESLPMREKYKAGGERAVGKTKVALRRAFADVLPPGVIGREKASFPLPFQNWIGCARRAMLESDGLRAMVREDAIQAAAANPSQHWNLAWPMANLAIWMEAIGAEARERRSVAA